MQKPAWTYLGLAYLITWTITLVSYFFYRAGTLTLNKLNLVYNLGALGPVVAAFASSWLFYGAEGVRGLCSTVRWQGLSKLSLRLAFSPLVFLR